MDKSIIKQKVDNLINCLHRINLKFPSTAEMLINDYDLQDIISINIERSIQSCMVY